MSTPSIQACLRCNQDAKLRERSFSDQALTALVTWGELEARLVGKPLCDDCYADLREVLIDRATELQTQPLGKPDVSEKTKKPRTGKRAG